MTIFEKNMIYEAGKKRRYRMLDMHMLTGQDIAGPIMLSRRAGVKFEISDHEDTQALIAGRDEDIQKIFMSLGNESHISLMDDPEGIDGMADDGPSLLVMGEKFMPDPEGDYSSRPICLGRMSSMESMWIRAVLNWELGMDKVDVEFIEADIRMPEWCMEKGLALLRGAR